MRSRVRIRAQTERLQLLEELDSVGYVWYLGTEPGPAIALATNLRSVSSPRPFDLDSDPDSGFENDGDGSHTVRH